MISLVEQTIGITNLQIILIDDCSSDGTLEKLKHWEEKYSDSVTLIPLDENVKQGAARNIAMPYVTGEYICFLDSDDWLVKTALKKLYSFAKRERTDIVTYKSKEVLDYEPADILTKTEIKDRLYVFGEADEDKRAELVLKGDIPRGCWDKFFLTSFVKKYGFRFAEGVFDEESMFTIPAMLEAGRIYYCGECLHRYFQNPEGTCIKLYSWPDNTHRDDNAITWMNTYMFMNEKGLIEKHHDLFEALFVINYFGRSLGLNAKRGCIFDAKTVNVMQDTVHAFFPDYKENKYEKDFMIYKNISTLIETPVDETNIEDYNRKIRKSDII